VITGNSVPDLLDRKHYLAVTGRSLNEHEDVDKPIFEIVEGAELRERFTDLSSNNSSNFACKTLGEGA
jgi:hypothetical protein